jgi:hypothetical protein
MRHTPRTLFLGLSLAALLAGCANQAPLHGVKPAEPSALVADTGQGGGPGGGAFFYVKALDGRHTDINNLDASRAASAGKGQFLVMKHVQRYIHAGHVKLRLAGQFTYAAPIQNLFNSASSYAVEGEVEVDLQPDASYRVNGTLDAFRREVWLETEAGERVGPVIAGKATDTADTAIANASYTCCNLHYEGDWISDTNASTLPFIPAGARIVVKDYGRHRAHVLIDGRAMRIGHDFGREQESREQFVAKLVTAQDPRQRIATFSAPVQAAIQAGKVMPGMSREQVIISLGYPRTDVTPSTDKAEWTYWTAEDNEFVLVWGPDGLLQDLRAPDWLKELMLYSAAEAKP